MQLFNTICTLAMASIAAAAPAPGQLEPRAGYWSVVGWGNPNCQGNLLWAYQGTGNACQNVPTLAASVTTYIQQNTQFEWRPSSTCGLNRRDDDDADGNNSTVSTLLEARGGGGDDGRGNALAARQVTTGCSNAPVLAFKVTFV
ncbi:hypothetical protein C8A00DRAFT_11813 [Chaetomidium leptoderma]|uniref:Uncharacterized protein n=1 Tax=Chaetomidium leptoderma TaxID=669021 RepID=A0AAN6VTT1_9PEZI|nr:hypothetical protein C8A00DRAFT_11813 [Chaetomidium leptoderma]